MEEVMHLTMNSFNTMQISDVLVDKVAFKNVESASVTSYGWQSFLNLHLCWSKLQKKTYLKGYVRAP